MIGYSLFVFIIIHSYFSTDLCFLVFERVCVCWGEEMELRSSVVVPESPRTYKTLAQLIKLSDMKACFDTKRKWYQCQACPFRGRRVNNLRLHVYNVHTKSEDIKWLDCGYCSYRTKQKSNLRQHILGIHTDMDEAIWYSCSNCSYKTKFKYHLKRHFYTNHAPLNQIVWYNCNLCPYKAIRKYLLVLHIRNMHTNHDKIFWHECTGCSYRTKQKINLGSTFFKQTFGSGRD